MKYNKEQKERIFKIYKKLQRISEPLSDICDVHINIEFSSNMHYINGFYGERQFAYNTEILIEDFFNINKFTTFVIFKEVFYQTDNDEDIKCKIKNIKNFIKKFIEDNKDRNLKYVKDYKE